MMIRPRSPAILLFLALFAATAARGEVWVTGYYTGWRQNRLPADRIDFDAVTHVVHFAVVPRADGTIDAASNMLTPANVASAVRAAHLAGKKILFAVGGRDSRAGFEGAMSDRNRDVFIAALIRFLREHRYDGIDVDMEDMGPENARDYSAFIKDLRERLDAISPRPLLTAAVLWEPALFARLSGRFDQVNVMTYGLSGPYPGWISWHDGALYDGGGRLPNSKRKLPSADGLIKSFLAAGVAPSKLGIGLSFNGSVWTGSGVDGPRAAWAEPPRVKSVPYYALAAAYKITEYDYDHPAYRWDDEAGAAYLSVPAGGGATGQFVSYANEITAERMGRYVRERGLGGMIVWDLAAGYRAELPAGRRDLLLQAVKKARFPPGEP